MEIIIQLYKIFFLIFCERIDCLIQLGLLYWVSITSLQLKVFLYIYIYICCVGFRFMLELMTNFVTNIESIYQPKMFNVQCFQIFLPRDE